MKKVLVLGAGMVARPPVQYLLDKAGFQVTIGTRTTSRAEPYIEGRPQGKVVKCLADDTATMSKLIAEHDLTISLLPAPQHPVVARLCIEHGKQMVTTSYVGPPMRELDGPAKQAGIMLLNEIGVDPGIDHMSAMKIIHDVERRGGKITSFRSYCGGLPAPEANTNPWGYKFSWAPRGVLVAGKNNGRYLQDGKEVNIPGPDLFTDVHPVKLDEIGELEAYPNRDSLGYIDVYGLKGIGTMYRGTFRNPGWCATWKKIADLGLLDEEERAWPKGATYRQFMESFVKRPTGDLRRDLAAQLGLEESSHVLDWWKWLGLFGDTPLGVEKSSPLDLMCPLLQEKCKYAPGERDMIVMRHEFRAEYPGKPAERITSTMIDFGIPHGDTSMARTVGLPAAIGARMVLDGTIKGTGVHVPVTPHIYEPVLQELETMDIRLVEKTMPAA